MYNTNIVVNYNTVEGDESDTTYRKQLLEFVKLTEFSDDVNTKVEALYDTYKDNDDLKKILPVLQKHLEQRWPFEMDNKTIFIFLFAFDYFYLTYPFISSLINNDEDRSHLVEPIISKINLNIKSK
jgi:hypothetical protein